VARPRGLAWSSAADRVEGLSETFGTIRYGRLAEILLYDIRRTATLAGQSAVYIDVEAEKWLKARMAATEVAHVVHAPSNPPGWSAGKWGEWYPDILGPDKKLTTKIPKPYWQPGWLKQHDRLMAAMAEMKGRVPLVVSGDMHSIALGKMLRSGSLDLARNPINVALSGTIGTSPVGWPSVGIRGTPALPSAVARFQRDHRREQHGFTLIDLHPTRWCSGSNGPQHATGRSDRHARAVPHRRAATAGVNGCSINSPGRAICREERFAKLASRHCARRRAGSFS
jgi:hypothetical protein